MVFPNRSSNRGGRCRGGAAAELVAVAPLLLFILIVAIDFCRLFFDYTIITNAARNGALYASDPRYQSLYANFQAAALADANNLNPALTAANVTSSGPTGGQVSVTVQYQFNMMSAYLGFSNVNLSRTVWMRVAPP